MSIETVIAIVIGSIFGIISITQTWRIHNYNKKNIIRKSVEFYYQIMDTFSFEQAPYEFSIKYNTKHYKKLFIVEGIIGNGGNVVFSDDYLLKPLVIRSENQIEILECEIIDQTKDILDFEIKKVKDNGNDIISVSLNNIEPKDAFKIRLLIGSDEDSINLSLDGLIKDENVNIKPKVKKIDRYDYTTILVDEGHRQEERLPFYFLLLAAILAGIYFGFVGMQKLYFLWLNDGLEFTLESSETLSFFLAIGSYIGLVIVIIKMIKRYKSKQKEKQEEIEKKEREKEPSLTGFGPWFDLRIKSEDVYKKYR